MKKPDWTWYATGPGIGIQMKSGRLIVPCDNYVAGSKVQQAQKRLEVLKTNVEKLKVESEDPATPAARREEYARQIRQVQREMEDEQESARKTVDKTSGDTFRLIYREVEAAANKIAQARALELVLFYTDALTEADFYSPNSLQRKLSQPGALMPLVVAPGMDITDTLIEAIDRSQVPADGTRR